MGGGVRELLIKELAHARAANRELPEWKRIAHEYAKRIEESLGYIKREKTMDQKPSIGRVVHYVLAVFDNVTAVGEHRPAFIVRVWPGEYGTNECPDGVNLQVFLDGGNDRCSSERESGDTMWKTSVEYSAEGKPGTWHWPERA